MRILITQHGDEIFKAIAEEEKEKKLKEDEDTILKRRDKFRMSLKKETESMKKTIAHEINIKQRVLPKNITDRYNDDKSSSSTVIPKFNIAISLDENNLPSFNNSLKLKSILKHKSISDLKIKLIDDKVMKDRHTVIDETKFRTIYEDRNVVDKIEQKLDFEIDVDNVNLIKYLNKKEIISDKLIDKLNTYDKEKVNKIDKICQMINEQDDHHKNIADYIKSQFKDIRAKNTQEIKSNINKLESQIDHYSYILSKYPVTVKTKDKFKDIHLEMQNKYWKKYKADLLQRTSWRMNKDNHSSSEILNYQSKNLNNE
jgi:hypothetical protein